MGIGGRDGAAGAFPAPFPGNVDEVLPPDSMPSAGPSVQGAGWAGAGGLEGAGGRFNVIVTRAREA